MMNQFSSNLKQLRTQKGWSQQQLADLLQVGRTAIANYESGIANPGHKTLLAIVKIFDLSLDEMLYTPLLVNPLKKESTTMIVTVNESGKENIVMVDTKAAAGYPTRYLEPEFYKELPAFQLPGADYRNGSFRCFQVEGDSMNDTIYAGDFVIARFCENHFRDVKDGQIHVVVTQDTVLVKRLITKPIADKKIVLLSDNSTYPPLELQLDDVKEIWGVRSKLSSYMPVKRDDLDKLIGDLTTELQMLKHRIDSIERGQ